VTVGVGLTFSLLDSGEGISFLLLSICDLKNAGVLQSDFLDSKFDYDLF